jgi:S1-C subfamily serine protease
MATSWTTEAEQAQIPGALPGITRPDIADSYLADVRVNPGNSGGPVYSVDRAQVIGVAVPREVIPPDHRPLVYNSGLTNVIPVQYVVELLKKNNVKAR